MFSIILYFYSITTFGRQRTTYNYDDGDRCGIKTRKGRGQTFSTLGTDIFAI
jgi:hypothetical protein